MADVLIRSSLLGKVTFCAIVLIIFLNTAFLPLVSGRKKDVNKFPVSNVKKEKVRFKSATLKDYAGVVAEHWKSRNQKEKKKLIFEVGRVNNEKLVDPTSMAPRKGKNQPEEAVSHTHGFISTVLTAYSQHLSLVLSPDDFWLLISLGIGQFLGGNPEMAEKYRDAFVNHTGKKKLVVRVDKYGISPKNPDSNGRGWPMAIEEMTELIMNETATNISAIMTNPFSTTGLVEQTVMRMSLMETMKNYFEYHGEIQCGIPEITLAGSGSDYRSLIHRVNDLRVMFPDFAWYLNRVRLHLLKIYKTKRGRVDKDWWSNMVVYRPPYFAECGTEPGRFSGWLTDFIAFTASWNGKLVDNNGGETMNFEDCNTPLLH